MPTERIGMRDAREKHFVGIDIPTEIPTGAPNLGQMLNIQDAFRCIQATTFLMLSGSGSSAFVLALILQLRSLKISA